MKQREIQGEDGIVWSCVQAFSGAEGELAEKAQERIQQNDGKVPLVCTPNGGEQSVRLNVPAEWAEQMSDADLLDMVAAAREEKT